jgi:hypothetical protein
MIRLSAMLALVVASIVILPAMSVHAGPALQEALQGTCQRTVCTVRHNDGGDVDVFRSAARELVNERKSLVIDGYCASACVLLADLARSNTCITSNADFAVHKSFTSRVAVVAGRVVPVGPVIKRQDPPQSADINRWVYAHGGYPSNGVMRIPVSAALNFWRSCK